MKFNIPEFLTVGCKGRYNALVVKCSVYGSYRKTRMTTSKNIFKHLKMFFSLVLYISFYTKHILSQ